MPEALLRQKVSIEEQNVPRMDFPRYKHAGLGEGIFREQRLYILDLFGFVDDQRSAVRERSGEREFAGIQRFEPISRTHESQLNILHVGRAEDGFYYVMELADDMKVGDMTVTFKLKKNATFHDGTPVTANDVKWSLDRAVSTLPISGSMDALAR